MKRLFVGLLCMTLSAAALADGVDAARKRAVGSMLVTGHIEVLSSGNVGRYDIDESSKLPSAIVQLIGKTVPQWQFEPVVEDGKPVTEKSKMSLRVAANPVADGKYAISIIGAEFSPEVAKSGTSFTTDQISEKSIPQPLYPHDLVQEHVAGTVYVLLRVDRTGNVVDASAQQVNLRVAASEREMIPYRKMLALAATSALKHWTFNIPTTGKEADRDYWIARVPVNFNIAGDRIPGYGEWDVYIPGPLEPAPWINTLPTITDDKLLIGNVDATPAGGSLLSAGGLHLITKISGT
jgi:hypothetical protein